jgi:hypothetical protein
MNSGDLRSMSGAATLLVWSSIGHYSRAVGKPAPEATRFNKHVAISSAFDVKSRLSVCLHYLCCATVGERAEAQTLNAMRRELSRPHCRARSRSPLKRPIAASLKMTSK